MVSQEFAEAVQKRLSERMPDIEVTKETVLKNNNIRLTGLNFHFDEKVVPVVYLDSYQDLPVEDAVDKIMDAILKAKGIELEDISLLQDFDSVKSRIIFSLINYDMNQELLSGIPHIKYLDLAIIFKCVFTIGEKEESTTIITNDVMAFWNISVDELYNLAKENTISIMGLKMRSLNSLLGEMAGYGSDYPAVPVYVVTNSFMSNGAGCILYEGILQNIFDQIHEDYYVIPSSIHEVLIMPQSHYEKSELLKLVVEVNHSKVAYDAILSDSIYLFNRNTKDLEIYK